MAEGREHRELLCDLCDRDYPVWFAPHDVWNAVVRQGGVDEWAFLCPLCFSLIADERRPDLAPTGWILHPEGEPRIVRTTAACECQLSPLEKAWDRIRHQP
jgi:hypothetical protein